MAVDITYSTTTADSSLLRRRSLLRLGLAAPALACLPFAGAATAASQVLRLGDQRGAVRSTMEAAGVLADLPYQVEWAVFPVGAPLVAAIGSGALDFGYVGDATTTFALAAGSPIKTINIWTFKGSANAIVVPKSAPYRDATDLKGRRVSFVRGSPGHLLVLTALLKVGLSLSDIVAVPLSAADARIALKTGSIDAWAIWDPYAAMAELDDGMRPLLTNEGTIDEVECGVASNAAIETKRSLLIDFLARVRNAYIWADANPEAHAAAFTRDTGVPDAVSKLTFSRQHVTVLRSVTDEAIRVHQHVADLYATAGVISHPIQVAATYDRSFVIP